MIRTTVVARSRTSGALRTGAAAASVVGVAVLAGCSGAADAEASSPQATPEPAASTPAPATAESTGATGSAAPASTYADGSYTADGTYVDGGGVAETVTVTLTLQGDVVTAVDVTGDAKSPQSRQYQQAFIGGISDEVVGKDIDTLAVSRVAGSSLTSGGFNEALETIKADARS